MNLDENIKKRYELYGEVSEKRIKCFINVGGNITSLGDGGDWQNVGCGIIKNRAHSIKTSSGLIGCFLSEGIPVINMLNVKQLAIEYGLPIDPYPIPQIGEDKIYYRYNYPFTMIIVVFLIAIMAIYLYR